MSRGRGFAGGLDPGSGQWCPSGSLGGSDGRGSTTTRLRTVLTVPSESVTRRPMS